VDVTRVFTSAFRQASGPPLPNLRLECWQQGKDDDNTGITCFIAAVVGWKKGETAADKKAVSDSDPAADFATAHRLLFNELSRQSRELIRATSQSSAGGDGRAVGDENPVVEGQENEEEINHDDISRGSRPPQATFPYDETAQPAPPASSDDEVGRQRPDKGMRQPGEESELSSLDDENSDDMDPTADPKKEDLVEKSWEVDKPQQSRPRSRAEKPTTEQSTAKTLTRVQQRKRRAAEENVRRAVEGAKGSRRRG